MSFPVLIGSQIAVTPDTGHIQQGSGRRRHLSLDTMPQDPIPAQATDHFHASLSPTPEEDERAPQEPLTQGRAGFSLGKTLQGFVNQHQENKARKREEARTRKIRDAEAKIRRVAQEQGTANYFKEAQRLQKELFPEAGSPHILPETLHNKRTESLWQFPTLTRQVDLTAPNGRPYHLLTEEMGHLKTPKPHFQTHPEGTLLRLELTGPSPEKLTNEIWPNPNVEYEHTEYTPPEALDVKRGFARLKHSIQKQDKQLDDVLLRNNLFKRLHQLINQSQDNSNA